MKLNYLLNTFNCSISTVCLIILQDTSKYHKNSKECKDLGRTRTLWDSRNLTCFCKILHMVDNIVISSNSPRIR